MAFDAAMSTHEDLLATIRYVRDRTGDPNAWQTGLTPTEVTAVVTSTTRSEQLDAILRKIRQRHSNLYYPAPPDREQGDAARAIADAEAALAHQNSATAQLDLQVVSAILNAHLKTVEGGESLHELQQEIEAAVRIRSDLDTPAGARDFQRFLIGKLKDIREVVATASLDAASKSALMAAWTSLYDASKGDRGDADAADRRRSARAARPHAVPVSSRSCRHEPNPIASSTRCCSRIRVCWPMTYRCREAHPRQYHQRRRRQACPILAEQRCRVAEQHRPWSPV
ncbi:Biofilm regulator [Mycobacterium tuberculosis]|nr:Biofilm regulator [Mycobacterium tuberculosis]